MSRALQCEFINIIACYPTKNISIATSPNGWTDHELCEWWFRETFVPNALAHRVNDKPIVLTVDGHDSHETDKLKAVAYEYGIIVIAFPSKMTHKLQPLDVGVFSSLQRKWTAHCGQCTIEGVKIDRYNFIPEYMKVRSVITPALIKKSFARTGIYPFNPNVFDDQDFAPSKASSRDAHLPFSYPPEVGSPQTSAPVTINREVDNETGLPQLEPRMECDDADANLGDEDTEDIGMDKGAEDESEGSDPEDDEESGRTFYYDPSLDGPRKVLPDHDHEVAGSISHSSSTIRVQDPPHFSLGPSGHLPTNETITLSANPPECGHIEATASTASQESMISEHSTHVSAPMAPPIHGPSLFTGPLIPLPSASQFLQMSEDDCWTYICQLHLQGQALMATVAA